MKKFDLFDKCLDFLNYICVSQNYLNKLVVDTACEEDLKDYSCGHWGTCPAVNFLYVHLINFFKRHNLRANIIVGTGHSGSSVNANLWLCGELKKHNKCYELTKNGLDCLIENFGKTTRTEINPHYPTTVYDGGELGYSLAFAYGYAQNNNIDILPCIIGDGECETATLCASWQLNRLALNKKVLPIINLNGLKMCSNSYLSRLNNLELKNLFSSYGYTVHIVTNNHKLMYKTLEKIYKDKTKNHLIILKSPKGFGAVESSDLKIENTLISHKNPLSSIQDKTQKANIVTKWLNKYKHDFFDDDGLLTSEISNFYDYNFEVPKNQKIEKIEFDSTNSKFENIQQYLEKQIKKNNLTILSPDEIISNKLSCLLEYKDNVLELLSENVLQAYYQGLIQSGNIGLFVSYEAFAPVVTSMVSQYLKYLYQSTQCEFRTLRPSMNFLLTSTVFENTFSHQNPEFVMSIIGKEYKNIGIYYPINSKQTIQILESCTNEQNKVNAITVSKACKDFDDIKISNSDYTVICSHKNPDLILCTTGDYVLNQMLSIKSLLEENLPNIKINLIYITNLMVLKNIDVKKIFIENTPIMYSYMGYKSVIKNLLFDKNLNIEIFGYEDKSNVSGCVENKLRYNEMGKLHVIFKALQKMLELNKINRKQFKNAKNNIFEILAKYYDEKILNNLI